MIVDQLNNNSYKNACFYEKDEEIFLRLNLNTKDMNLDDFKIEDINLGNAYEIMAKASKSKEESEKLEKGYVDGSYKFLENILGRISEINTDYDNELIKQPYAESFLKVLPPLVTASLDKKEIVWNLENMKEKESMGKLIDSLSIKSENSIVKKNLEQLNGYIYGKIRERILEDSKILPIEHVGFPAFNKLDFTEILNKRKLKNIFQEKEQQDALDFSCEKLANNLNLYFGSIPKNPEFNKHFLRFKKYITENPSYELNDLAKVARKRKPKRDILKLKMNELKKSFNVSTKFTAERILEFSLSRTTFGPKIIPLTPMQYLPLKAR